MESKKGFKFSEIIQTVLLGMLIHRKILDFFGRFWDISLFMMMSWWRHHRDPAGNCYSEAPTDLASRHLNHHTARRLSPTYWKAEIQGWTDEIFTKIGNFYKILVRSTFVFKYFWIFHKERTKLTLTYGKISKPESNGEYSCRSGESSPVSKRSFLTTSLKIKLGNSFDFRKKSLRLPHLAKTKWYQMKN